MLTKNEQIIVSIIIGVISFIIYSEYKDKIQKSSIKNILPFIVFFIITLFNIYQHRKLTIKELMLDDKIFLFWLIICIVITVYVLGKKKVVDDDNRNNTIKESFRKAFIALVIAYFAKLELVITPFFLVIIFYNFSYQDWV